MPTSLGFPGEAPVYVVDRRGRVRYGGEGELNSKGQKGETTVRKVIDALLAERP